MQRITRKELDGAVAYLNRITRNESEPYRLTGTKPIVNIGNFHLSGAYGGFALHQMGNESGGTSDVFSQGHMPMRELYNLIHAYAKGIVFATEKVTP